MSDRRIMTATFLTIASNTGIYGTQADQRHASIPSSLSAVHSKPNNRRTSE